MEVCPYKVQKSLATEIELQDKFLISWNLCEKEITTVAQNTLETANFVNFCYRFWFPENSESSHFLGSQHLHSTDIYSS